MKVNAPRIVDGQTSLLDKSLSINDIIKNLWKSDFQ